MPKNRKLQNIIGVEHITDAAESAIAAQASGGATVAFKNVAVSGQDNVVADAATDTLTLVGGSNVTITTDASADSVTIAAAAGSPAGSDTFVQYNNGGSSFGATTLAYDDTADAEQFSIDIASSKAPLKIVQTGAGNAFEVHDAADPDNNRFEIDQYGRAAVQGQAGTNSAALYAGGSISSASTIRAAAGSNSAPAFGFDGDTNTGMYHGGADALNFTTGGTDRMTISSAGVVNVTGSLTVGGAAVGGGQNSHTPQLAVDLFGAASSLVTVYPLLAGGQSANDTTSDQWNDNVSTTTLFLWPCIAAKTGTISGLQLRTGAVAGDTLYIGLYKSDADGLPNGAAAFTNTISTATNTSYTPTISVSGVTKGDILYFATFGQSTRTNLRVIDVSDGGTFVIGRGISSVNYSAGGNSQIIQLSGQTNGTFPTLSSSTQYTGVGEPDFVPRIGITYS